MGCSNCFNNCSDITSDQCVKYTGADISALGITTGENLSSVQSKITTYLLDVAGGGAIIPTIDQNDLCSLVSSYLPVSGDITLNHVISALIQSACSLKTDVDSVTASVAAIEADYTVGCLSGVSASSGTHSILQAVITKLCAVDSSLTSTISDLTTNYVEVADLNSLIQAYLDSISTSNLQKSKMVPYVAYEYYGSLSNFDSTGKGSGEWVDVYLCNGNYGTPDKRGRVAVGTTDGSMRGGALDSAVDPLVQGNVSFGLAQKHGSSTVILTEQNIPEHTHIATAEVTSTPHTHFVTANGPSSTITANNTVDQNVQTGSSGQDYTLEGTSVIANLGKTSAASSEVSVSVTNATTGGGIPHSNIQPTIGAYFIMYIP